MATSPAGRGKYAETRVKEYLERLSDAHMSFCFNRNLDAHAAGGKFPAQAGDFQAFRLEKVILGGDVTRLTRDESHNYIIEVKEVKHAFRLPQANYSADKVARIEKRVRAGTEAIVMICHTDQPTKVWRAVPHSVFLDRSKPSWDLREWPIVDMKKALSDFLGVLP